MATSKKGIDVSKHNGVIEWSKVSKQIDFAIIRAGYGKEEKQKDPKFEYNYEQAKKYGVPVGAYVYSYAATPLDAEKEAEVTIKWLKGKKFEYPIYFDIEDKTQTELSRATCTAITNAFCKKLEAAGYWVGVYSFDSFFKTHLSGEIQNRYAVWVARTPAKENDNGAKIIMPSSCKKYQMHQFSFKGKVNGINGDVDLNLCYVDYPTNVKLAKKNGYSDTKYSVTARAANLQQSKATEISEACSKMGMTVVISEGE